MKFYGIALVASAFVLGACGGGESAPAADSAATAAPAPQAAAPAATPATGTPMAVTGQWHEVKMVGDEKGYRYEPAEITVKAGDGIKFIMVSGGPHNVAFDPATIPAEVKGQLSANMPNQQAELSSPMFLNANEVYELSLAGIAPGTYDYFCTPHLAMAMKGKITVTQ